MGDLRVANVVTALGITVPLALGFLLPRADEGPDRRVFSFVDPEIVESSGLVWETTPDGARAITVNDSGDTGRVFTVDAATGETTGVTFWSDAPTDVEAVAPAGPGEVWVADIGDNRAARDSVSLSRVPVGDGDRTVSPPLIDLVYPDGSHDAEALLVHPDTGRLYIATKGVLGGTLYAAPPHPGVGGPNLLGEVGPVPGIVTDGAFLDADHVVLRSYSKAFVLTFPALEQIGSLDLPEQEQGEGLAVGPDGALYLTSEGRGAPVLRVPLPREVRRSVAATSSSASQTPSTPPSPSSSPPETSPEAEPYNRPWYVNGILWLIVVGVLVLALRPR